MTPVRKSVEREIGDGDVRHFSAFQDILEQHIAAGEVESVEDLLERKPGLLGTILFEWYRQAQIACIFAMRLARDPDSASWQSIIALGEIDCDAISEALRGASERFEALQIIFPGTGDARQAVDILNSLCRCSEWTASEVEWINGEVGDTVQIGLRWHPPGNEYLSWVLGVAPFESMPFTRRFVGAPFIALIFRPSAPTAYAKTPTDETGIDVAHLAHMDDQLGSDEEKRSRVRTVTERGKDALLGDDLRSAARAKVTFSLPGALRGELTCLVP